MSKKRVAVIGAGVSGLAAIKCCLEEGLKPVCFERAGYIGGLWHYTQEVVVGQACVMKSTVVNTSKEMMSFSDFPVPAEFPIYMHNTLVDKYLHMYADTFHLKPCIQLQTEVMSVQPSSIKGDWDIRVKRKDSSQTETHTFSAVLVCTGHYAHKSVPPFPGLDRFEGRVVHTHEYKDHRGYEDKRVLIVGIGNSGGDVAVELSRITSQIYLSTRSGAWLFNRVAEHGDPIDMLHTNRFVQKIRKLYPKKYIAKQAMTYFNKRFDHARYGLQPKYPPFAAQPTLNDELPNRIISGGVIVKANVREFTETGVIFEDGTAAENIDVVIFATGYVFGFPFLDNSITEVKDNTVQLYKYMYPPDMDAHTLAIIGCFQPLGAVMPLCEMQCRLATKVFKGEVTLPNRTDMWSDIRNKQQAMAERFYRSPRHTIQVDYLAFMDELAEMVGCKPNLVKLFFMSPKLALTCFFGPATPYQFRLNGHGKWHGARECILQQWDRTYRPLDTRKCNIPPAEKGLGPLLVMLIVAIMGVMLLYTNLLWDMRLI